MKNFFLLVLLMLSTTAAAAPQLNVTNLDVSVTSGGQVELSNDAAPDLTGINVSIGGNGFTIDNNGCGATLVPNASCNVAISCADANETGTLTFTFDNNVPAQTVDLTCRAGAASNMQDIPTLSEWGMIMMSALMGFFFWSGTRRRQQF